MTTVSVVVATRDRPVELREAVAAIRGQEHDGVVETLIVYDRSEPDLTLAVADERRPVRVLTNTRTPGLAGARNTGILAAGGDLVAFCDDDDLWLPGKLGRQIGLFAADPAVGLVATGIRVRYTDRTVDRMLDDTSVTFADLLRSRLTELHPSTFCLRRERVVDGFGLVEEQVPGGYGEDYELLLRAARDAPVQTVPEVLVEVRWHEGSYFDSRWATISEALRWLLGRYPEFHRSRAGYARIAGQIAVAEAALGHRRPTLRWTSRCLRRNPFEARGYLAVLLVSRFVRVDRLVRALHRRGRGI